MATGLRSNGKVAAEIGQLEVVLATTDVVVVVVLDFWFPEMLGEVIGLQNRYRTLSDTHHLAISLFDVGLQNLDPTGFVQ